MDAIVEPFIDRIRSAAMRGEPLRLRGSGTKDFLGETLAGAILDTRPLAGIVDYEPTELVITARGGTPLSAIETLLQARGQFLAFEPPRFRGDPTIGGVVAAGLSGPRRAAAGGVRDYVLGVTVLNGLGERLVFGGRVMKNVAGFDVSRLMAGSFGILGLIVDVSLRVMPVPAAEVTLMFEVGAQRAVSLFNQWARRPLPLSATYWHAGEARVRLSGAETAVAAAQRVLGGSLVEASDGHATWSALRDHQHPFLATPGPLWRLSMPSTTADLALDGGVLIEWGGALRWLRSDEDPTVVRAAARAAGGSAALWYGDCRTAAMDSLDPATFAVHRRLKAAFDPRGVFNPGRLVPGL